MKPKEMAAAIVGLERRVARLGAELEITHEMRALCADMNDGWLRSETARRKLMLLTAQDGLRAENERKADRGR